jgi:DNA recombination protein RmuC
MLMMQQRSTRCGGRSRDDFRERHHAQSATFTVAASQPTTECDGRTASKTTGRSEPPDNAARVVGEMKQNLGELSKATQRVSMSARTSQASRDLKGGKLRGVIGELFLGDLLAQILPVNHFTLQHRFKSGEAVDAAIKIGQHLVPVDSKFPLENFKRITEGRTDEERKAAKKKFVVDVKKHMDAIADKYILPEEGTFPFALMYIPAENVYYETIIKDENVGEERSLSTYALGRKVIPVSPNSFYAYLQAIVLGLKGLQIEKSAQKIFNHLAQLRGDFERFSKEFEILGAHLNNARGKYDEAEKRLDRLGENCSKRRTGVSRICWNRTPRCLPPRDADAVAAGRFALYIAWSARRIRSFLVFA